MQTLTPQEEGACVGTEMSGGQPLPSCRTSNLNPPRLTSRRSQPPLALAVPLSRFPSRVGGGSAFYVRLFYRLPLVRNPQVTEFSSGRVWHRRDARPCYCAPKPVARTVPRSPRFWRVPPTHNGSCATSRRRWRVAGSAISIPWRGRRPARRPDTETTALRR